MMERFVLYSVNDLKFVDVRRYHGYQNGQHVWTFLGYDVVKVDEEGNAVSILSDEESKYKFLKKDKDKEGHDYRGINTSDIRVKVLDTTKFDIFGKYSIVSKSYIQTWIDNRPELYFVHYNNNTRQNKVKKFDKD